MIEDLKKTPWFTSIMGILILAVSAFAFLAPYLPPDISGIRPPTPADAEKAFGMIIFSGISMLPFGLIFSVIGISTLIHNFRIKKEV